MIIDERGECALTMYRRGNIVKSDHNMLKLEVDLTFHNKNKHERTEMFNLRNKDCQKDFNEKKQILGCSANVLRLRNHSIHKGPLTP